MKDLTVWKRTLSMKLLWNVSAKADKLWVRWVHIYYMKGKEITEVDETNSMSQVLKGMLKEKDIATKIQTWKQKVRSSLLQRCIRSSWGIVKRFIGRKTIQQHC